MEVALPVSNVRVKRNATFASNKNMKSCFDFCIREALHLFRSSVLFHLLLTATIFKVAHGWNGDLIRQSLTDLYSFSVRAVLNPTKDDISRHLWTIERSNRRLKWKRFPQTEWNAGPRRLFKRSQLPETQPNQIKPYQKDTELSQEMYEYVPLRTSPLVSSDNLYESRLVKRSIRNSEARVLMVTLTSSSTYSRLRKNLPIRLVPELWMTAHPQLQRFCQKLDRRQYPSEPIVPKEFIKLLSLSRTSFNTTAENVLLNDPSSSSYLTLRILQYLGLAPIMPTERKWVVTMWIDPKDLNRPCLDGDITRKECDLTRIFVDSEGQYNFTASPNDISRALRQHGGSSHLEWFRQMVKYSEVYNQTRQQDQGNNNADLESIFPWTRLGYTFDYGNINEKMGATEFLLKPHSIVWIDNVVELVEYCD